MAKILQFRRGETADLSAITGNPSEIFYDSTKKTIVVHDGSTPGGIELTKRSETVILTEPNTYSDVNTFQLPIIGSVTGNAGTSTKLTTARNISLTGSLTGSAFFDGSANISINTVLGNVNWNLLINKPTTLSGFGVTDAFTKTETNTLLSQKANTVHSHVSTDLTNIDEAVQDIVGAMVASNIESGISVTYDDDLGKLNFGVSSPTITLTGNVTGSGTLTNLGNLSFSTTIADGSVTLGTKTTGNYVSDVTNGSYILKSGTAGAGWSPTLSVDATSSNTNSKIVARDSSGNFSAGIITATLVGNASTSTKLATPVLISGSSFDGSSDISISFANLSTKPTTLSGYGITDAQALNTTLTNVISLGSAGDNGFLRKSGVNTWYIDTNTYLTGNQSISVSGDATGTGSTSIVLTLANSGVVAGTYNNSVTAVKPFTVDAKGRITAVGTEVTLTPAWGSITTKPTTLSGYGITDAQALNTNLTNIVTLSGNGTNGILRKTGVNTWSIDSATYLTTNQTITLSGDLTGSGSTTISATLANSGVTAGTYNNSTTSITPLIIDAKGRITGTGTSVTLAPAWASIASKPTTITGFGITDAQPLDGDLTAIAGLAGSTGILKKTALNSWVLDTNTYLTGNQTITASGDITGSGTTNLILSLGNSGVTAGTYQSVTVDLKGRVISGTNPSTLAGFGITDATPSTHVGSGGSAQHSIATTSLAGFLSSTDKTKLDSIEYGANVLPQALSATSSPTFNVISINGMNLSSNFDLTSTGSLNFNSDTIVIGNDIASVTTLNGNVNITGNLHVDGEYWALIEKFIESPMFMINGTIPLSADDNRDRGVQFRWHDGSNPKLGFFGFDDSTGKFTFIPDSSDTSDVISGTKGTIDAYVEWNSLLNKPTNILSGITVGSHITLTGTPSSLWAADIALDATHLNTGNAIVSRDASGNFTAGTITATLAGSASSCSGNAATSTKLENPRNISLSGDVSGSASFDGSANISITSTVANNSHTHDNTTVDSLDWSKVLSKPAPAITVTLTGDTTGSAVNTFTNLGNGTISVSTTLANSGVSANTYKSVTVDAKGRVTAGTNPTTISGYGITDAINVSQKGVANGVATLGADGLVPSIQLPSYVDDILEFANLAVFPGTGETGKIYIALDTNKTYRWSGSVYVYITSGAVDSVAGKTGIVSLVKGDVGLGSVDNTADNAKNVLSSTKLFTARNIALTGPVTGTVSFDGTADVSISTTITNDSITLGTHTSGSYVASGSTSGSGISGSVNAESGVFTVTSNGTSSNTNNTLVFRDASGNFSASNITATKITSNEISMTSAEMKSYTVTVATVTPTEVSLGTTVALGTSKVVIQAVQGSNIQSTELLIISDGSNVHSTEYATIASGSALASYSVNINGGNINLVITGTSITSTVYKILSQNIFK